MTSGYHLPVEEHYEKYPYPTYPWWMIGRYKDLTSVDLSTWGIEGPVNHLWLAGCGTIAPAMFSRRNPQVKILATDLSNKTLLKARWRLLLLGGRNVRLKQEDIFEARYNQVFDAVDAYGVIHHTVSPEKALTQLMTSLRVGGVLRLMVYSEHARENIQKLREEIQKEKITDIYKLQKYLDDLQVPKTGDLKNNAGMADALLNPIAHVFSVEGFTRMIENVPFAKLLKMDASGNIVAFLQRQ